MEEMIHTPRSDPQPFLWASDLLPMASVLLQMVTSSSTVPNLQTSGPHTPPSHPGRRPQSSLPVYIPPAPQTVFSELGFLIRFIEKAVNLDFAPQEALGINLMRKHAFVLPNSGQEDGNEAPRPTGWPSCFPTSHVAAGQAGRHLVTSGKCLHQLIWRVLFRFCICHHLVIKEWS